MEAYNSLPSGCNKLEVCRLDKESAFGEVSHEEPISRAVYDYVEPLPHCVIFTE